MGWLIEAPIFIYIFWLVSTIPLVLGTGVSAPSHPLWGCQHVPACSLWDEAPTLRVVQICLFINFLGPVYISLDSWDSKPILLILRWQTGGCKDHPIQIYRGIDREVERNYRKRMREGRQREKWRESYRCVWNFVLRHDKGNRIWTDKIRWQSQGHL